MRLHMPVNLLKRIERHGEQSYPEEGAGILLGRIEGEDRHVEDLLVMENTFNPNQRRRRYLIGPRDMMEAEDLADQQGLEILGAFHSHPDHPARASDFDREWALPWYVYLITSVVEGKAGETRAWQLEEDREAMVEVEWRRSQISSIGEVS